MRASLFADADCESRLALLYVAACGGAFDVLFAWAYGVLRPADAPLLFFTPLVFASIPTLAAFPLPQGRGRWVIGAAALAPVALALVRGYDIARVTPFWPWAGRFSPFVAVAAALVFLFFRGSTLKNEAKAFVCLAVVTGLSILGLELRVPMTVPSPFRLVVFTFFASSGGLILISTILGARFGLVFRFLALALPLLLAPLARPTGDRLPPGHRPGPERPPSTPRVNTLVIVLDCVRADRLPPTAARTVRTPALDEFAGSAFVFRHAVASGNYTLPSHASLLTGMLPSEHGAHPRYADRGDEHGSIRPGIESFPARLRREGVSTFGVSGNHAFLSAWTGIPAGFDYFSDPPLRLFAASAFGPASLRAIAFWWGGSLIPVATYRPADDILAEVRERLEQVREPFFGLVNLMDAHDPRVLSARAALLSPGQASVRSYDEAVAFEDAQLGALFAWMRSRGLFDTTTIVVTSDHGEYLGDRGRVGHGVGSDEELLHVPLMVRPPRGLSVAQPVSHVIGLHEVLPWALNLDPRSPVPPPVVSGPRVLSEVWTNPGAGVVSGFPPDERVVYFDALKLVVPWSGRPRLFDLSRDPGETRDVWGVEPRGALMESAARRTGPLSAPPSRGAPSASDLERLRSLGYIR